MDAFEDFRNLISSINIEFSYVICILIIISVFIIEIILIKKGILNFKNNKKRMEKAIKLNHIVKAHRTSYFDDDTSGHDVHSWYHAKYNYIVNGKTKTYKYLSKNFPSYEITLYYVDNPNRLFHYEDKTSALAILIYIIPFIVAAILMEFFGISIK